MATNATTWFYQEPEHAAYYIEERVNQTFWSNRITNVYLDCTSEEPPFRMVGTWDEVPIEVEWVPRDTFVLYTRSDVDVSRLLVGIKEILGFPPTISFVDRDGRLRIEWYVNQPDARIREIQGNPNYHQVKRYTA